MPKKQSQISCSTCLWDIYGTGTQDYIFFFSEPEQHQNKRVKNEHKGNRTTSLGKRYETRYTGCYR